MPVPFSQAVSIQIRNAIREAGGNEVFFLGHTDDHCELISVEVLARGRRDAVPAVLQACRFGDVVLHNHPSGRLEPSSADLDIAGRLAELGVGFLIVDNEAESCYTVIEPFARQESTPLDPDEIRELLGPNGVIARNLPGYEERPQQTQMALAVADAFNRDRIALIEAGTGTGKSLAYLLPALLWALRNRERVVVSTNTINLQEQLIGKDLPFLQRATGLEFRAVLVKGRNNYICRRKLENARREPGLFDQEQAAELAQLIAWAEQSAEGSKEELPTPPRDDVWEDVCCEVDQCGRARCRHFQRCFLHRARRQAARADLLVVNHALLLSDLAVRRQTDNYSTAAVLPPFARVIIDEAHHLEDVATRYFAGQVNRFRISRLLNRLRHPRKPHKGLLPKLQSTLATALPDSADELYRGLADRIEELLLLRDTLQQQAPEELERAAADLLKLRGLDPPERNEMKLRVLPDEISHPCWQRLGERLNGLAGQVAQLADGIRKLLQRCDNLPTGDNEDVSSLLTDLSGMSLRLEALAADLLAFTSADEANCTWMELRRGRIGRGEGLIVRLQTAPLEVAQTLKDALYDPYRSLVMTSATLAVGDSFRYLRRRIGLDLVEPVRVTELRLASPFDYGNQACLLVPADLPEPTDNRFVEPAAELIERAILAADGRSFVLFTSYSLLRRIHGQLKPTLEARGYRCLRQGEISRHLLLRHFRQDTTSVLFATDSFWEGVDVPGRALEQVILTRLPFRVPTEPILEARAEEISRRGGDPFIDYTVPQAVLRFKQGFGRLIRHRDDRGVVLILDTRVLRRGYGRTFLRSLPEVPVASLPAGDIPGRIAHFFRLNSEIGPKS
ncbi:ATP-dependent DNA helicase DinG [Geothermobacter ehrlichii]|uniref:DNA 5'-3' helicase n=1 Tax=Geothermobacter ehrlichii TaxID=213224 RepID=A0A5D3WKZ6_9BACT|nr:helicase C-terminal domain-containing protein [Geothermobacter ehrlichii]TYO99330.1 ATP-dependent DNA helicase DinG [Geothermobacter ehrlichii]